MVIRDDLHSVPAIGLPWPEGRSVAPRRWWWRWILFRHGGRRTDSWKPIRWSFDDQDGRRLFATAEASMRQGGVVLVDPDGVVRARAWAPRLRTRW